MSMTVTAGDDSDELDDDLEEREDDEQDDDEDERPARRSKKPADDEEDDEDEDDDKSPEDLKAEIKRLRASLSKANASGNRRRQQLKDLRTAQAALSEKEDDDEDDDEEKPKQKATVGLDAKAAQRLISKAVTRRERELQEEHKRDLIDTRAESALVKAGVSEKNIRLLKRELDYDELELDPKTRSVDGIEEEIDRLRSEFPDLFKSAKAARRRINGGDDRDSASTKRRKPLSATEQQVLKLTGRAS